MAWEQRYGRAYLYTTERIDSGYVRRYHGRGSQAEKIACELQRRAQLRRDRKAECIAYEEALTPLLSAFEAVELLLRAVLLANGFTRHAKGEWRLSHRMNHEKG